MSALKFLYVFLFILAAAQALGYARYLYDQEKNAGGAAAVLAVVILVALALWQGRF